jgi:hypothetical protein
MQNLRGLASIKYRYRGDVAAPLTISLTIFFLHFLPWLHLWHETDVLLRSSEIALKLTYDNIRVQKKFTPPVRSKGQAPGQEAKPPEHLIVRKIVKCRRMDKSPPQE